MALNESPIEIVSSIVRLLRDPKDWVNCMRSCKRFHMEIFPLYLNTTFRVIKFYPNEIPACAAEKYLSETKKLSQFESAKKSAKNCYLVTDSKIIEFHYIFMTRYTTIYVVYGLHLPFIVDNPDDNTGNPTIGISINKMLEHYTFRFPNYMRNDSISNIIQNISLLDQHYTTIQFDYYQVLIEQMNIYYSKHTNFIGSRRHKRVTKHIDKYKKGKIDADTCSLEDIHFYFLKNTNYKCPLCRTSCDFKYRHSCAITENEKFNTESDDNDEVEELCNLIELYVYSSIEL